MKHIKNKIQTIFITLFIVIFSLFFSEQYLENYEKKIQQNKNINIIRQEINSFKIQEIRELKQTTFYYTPYKPLLDKIVNKINSSKQRIYLESYILTEKRIKQALINSKKRWVEIKILLEKNPYKANNINNKHYKQLKEKQINIKWSNPENYSLNHSKFIIIDDEAIISTWNFTYSTFAYNRDMFLFSKDQKLVKNLIELFKKDHSLEKSSIHSPNLVLSPEYSRTKISKLFEESKKDIKMYFQYLQDEKLEKLLIKKSSLWVNIEIIVSENFYLKNELKIKQLENNKIKIQKLKKPKMHSKAILIDDKYLFIWSINFSSYSLDKNREVWILLKNKQIIEKFTKLFEKDFAK